MSTNTEVGMPDLVKREWEEVQRHVTALHNAFGFVDDPTDPVWSTDTWHGAYAAAMSLTDSAENLADAAAKIAREREATIPEEG